MMVKMTFYYIIISHRLVLEKPDSKVEQVEEKLAMVI